MDDGLGIHSRIHLIHLQRPPVERSARRWPGPRSAAPLWCIGDREWAS